MSAIVRDWSPTVNAPSSQVTASAPRSTAARSCALARIFPVALAIAAGVPGDGLVLKPWPVPKRFSSAGTTFTSSGGTPSASATSAAYSGSLPSASVVRLSTILPVGCTRRKTARYASSATVLLRFDPLSLLMGGERVVFFQVAECGLRAAERMRWHGGALAARVDAGLGVGALGHPMLQPGVVRPLLGP